MFDNLAAEAYDREYSDRELLRRVATYFRPHKRGVAIILVTVAALAILSAGVPILISAGVGALAEPNNALLVLLGTAVLAAGVLTWAVNLVRRVWTARVVGDVVLALRRDAFDAAVHHDMSFYDRFATGKVVSRITSDTTDFAQTVVLVTDLVAQITTMALLGLVLWRISPRMTLVVMAWAPFVILMALAFRRVSRLVTQQGFRAMGEVNARIFETIAGIAVAKNFRREATVFEEFRGVNDLSYNINVRRGFVLATVFPVLNVLIGLGMAMVLYAGGMAAVAGTLALGAWFLYIQSLDRFFFPLINLASFASQVQAGYAAVERVFALIDHESAVQQLGAEYVTHLDGDIAFEHVCLRYNEGQVVLPDFSLHIRPGESVALVGHTGAGKSSLARLVARFYEFQDGRILIDGRDIRHLDLAEYRRHLGVVPQVPFLFDGTIADNVRYARPEARDDEILALAQSIGGGDWLTMLPAGLETRVGERGNRLSMGQRQLVALTRVLVQRPAIFILDEATASVDPFTESQIQDALDLILAKSTSIIIAHRLSTVKAADRIIVLDHGRIIEEGTHDALMATSGHYAHLYDTYFRHQSADYIVGVPARHQEVAP